jgi:hypothetical protein
VPRRTDLAAGLTESTRLVGLGRHYSVELRGVTEQNADGTDRQEVLHGCVIGEELHLIGSTNHHADRESLKICKKSGLQLGFVTPHTEVASKLVEGRKFRVKLSKLYPHRGHAGAHGAVLDFEEVEEVLVEQPGSGLGAKWIVIIAIGVIAIAAVVAKVLGVF